jgi:hypothetical protein
MQHRREFEVREVAQLIGTNPRRVEGWVEQGFLSPVVRGRGPGRRRVFDLANLFQAALLVELLSIFGERSRAVGRIVAESENALKGDARGLPERLAALSERSPAEKADKADAVPGHILSIELQRKGGVQVRLGFVTEIQDAASRALSDDGTVVLLNVTTLLVKLGRRLKAFRGR